MINHPYPVGTLCIVINALVRKENIGKQCVIVEELDDITWSVLEGDDEERTYPGYGVRLPGSDYTLYAMKEHLLAISPDGEDEEDADASPVDTKRTASA